MAERDFVSTEDIKVRKHDILVLCPVGKVYDPVNGVCIPDGKVKDFVKSILEKKEQVVSNFMF